MSNKDDGKSKSIEGAVKYKTRELINDPDLEAKSETERLNGMATLVFHRTRSMVAARSRR